MRMWVRSTMPSRERDQQVLAHRLDRLDVVPTGGRGPRARGASSRTSAWPDERRAQPGRDPVDGVALGHGRQATGDAAAAPQPGRRSGATRDAHQSPRAGELAEVARRAGPDSGVALALFDLDNTLVDRTRAFGAGGPVAGRALRAGPPVAVPFMIEADGDGGVGWDAWMGATIERFGIDTTVDEMRGGVPRASTWPATSSSRRSPTGCGGCGPRGGGIGVVTNGPPSQNDKITGTGLDRLVDGWAVSEEVGARKPDRRIFEVAAERCGAELRVGWMVGDSAPADMVGARNAGLRASGCTEAGLGRRPRPRPPGRRHRHRHRSAGDHTRSLTRQLTSCGQQGARRA